MMKLLTDFLPIALFFIVFKLYGIYAATVAAIILSLVQVGLLWYRQKSIEMIHIITMFSLVVLGGATLIFHNEWFIKWKPTAINWLLAIVFLFSQFQGSKPVIQRLMEKNIELPAAIWSRINLSWVIFFLTLGTLNLLVAYQFDTNTWVNFKLFGILGATLLFVILQAIYLTKYSRDPQE